MYVPQRAKRPAGESATLEIGGAARLNAYASETNTRSTKTHRMDEPTRPLRSRRSSEKYTTKKNTEDAKMLLLKSAVEGCDYQWSHGRKKIEETNVSADSAPRPELLTPGKKQRTWKAVPAK